MKKRLFWAAMCSPPNPAAVTFERRQGHIKTYKAAGGQKIAFGFSKNPVDGWTITELSTGAALQKLGFCSLKAAEEHAKKQVAFVADILGKNLPLIVRQQKALAEHNIKCRFPAFTGPQKPQKPSDCIITRGRQNKPLETPEITPEQQKGA